MSYQAKGLQLSLLIHAAIFLMITNTGISESRLNPPVAIDLGIIKEVLEEPPPPPSEEKKPEEPPKVEEIVPPPLTKIEPVQKKEMPVRTRKIREAPKRIARAEKKEVPPTKQEEVKEQPAPASDPAPEQPIESDKILGSAFSEGSAVAAIAPGGSGGEGVEGGTGRPKSASVSGSDEGSSDTLAFGSAYGPRYRHKEIPVYPAMARRLGKEGKVVLRLTIDENGNLVNIEVIEDSGYGFAEAAIAAVKKSSFHPPMMNGKPIRARALLPVKFALR